MQNEFLGTLVLLGVLLVGTFVPAAATAEGATLPSRANAEERPLAIDGQDAA